MKQIQINSILYENFKGIRNYTLRLNGQNASVSGRNALGKTTLFDGFYWLLFGKDSAENSKFDAKPFDQNGEEILGKEPVIEAELLIDGKSVTLRRELRETWSTVKNRLEKERKSDTTKYYINGVPCKTQKEYQSFIASIIDENIFKLLTNPFAFNSLHWKEKREILMGLVDEVSVEEVIQANPSLEKLASILEDRSPDEQKRIIKEKLKQLTKDIERFTDLFSEAERAIPNVEGLDKEQLERSLTALYLRLDDYQNEAAQIRNGGAAAAIQQELSDKRQQLNEERLKFQQDNHLAIGNLQNDLQDLVAASRKINNQIYDVTQKIERLNSTIERLTKKREQLLAEHKATKELTFDEHRTICKLCGQELPEDQIEDMKKKFNMDRAIQLEEIIESGKAAAAEIDKYKQQVATLEKEKVELEEQTVRLSSNKEGLEEELRTIQSSQGNFESTKTYLSLQKEMQALDEKIRDEQGSKQQLLNGIALKQDAVKADIKSINDQLSLFVVASDQQNRLSELKEAYDSKVNLYNELQGHEWLLDEYTRSSVLLLEKQINKQFKYADFKLFQLQKNGGIDEVCEATYKGIAYSNNLNNAARINVGLDIINTLSRHYGVTAPIFVDNAESVNELIETDSQLISLVVTKDSEFVLEVIS